MNTTDRLAIRSFGVLFLLTVAVAPVYAQARYGPEQRGFRGGGAGQHLGPGKGRSRNRMRGADERHRADHDVFQFLLANHDQINRTVRRLPNGVETVTESESPKIAAKIKDHVKWMAYRIEENHPIRMRDPLFAELFRHAEKIELQHEETEKGVRVTETSKDPQVAKLIQSHADVVSGFVERGFAEAMKNHAVPSDQETSKRSREFDGSQKVYPKIKDFGGVVPLREAAHQPVPGTRLVIDITGGGAAEQLNPAFEKVAKFANIYAGAGREPAEVEIAVVLHGKATLAALSPEAYSSRFETDGNPNLKLLHQLHETGIEIYVCGQSLVKEGSAPENVAVFIQTAVSALTAVANLQADGYVRIPLDE